MLLFLFPSGWRAEDDMFRLINLLTDVKFCGVGCFLDVRGDVDGVGEGCQEVVVDVFAEV